jgi:hypothetical protein
LVSQHAALTAAVQIVLWPVGLEGLKPHTSGLRVLFDKRHAVPCCAVGAAGDINLINGVPFPEMPLEPKW